MEMGRYCQRPLVWDCSLWQLSFRSLSSFSYWTSKERSCSWCCWDQNRKVHLVQRSWFSWRLHQYCFECKFKTWYHECCERWRKVTLSWRSCILSNWHSCNRQSLQTARIWWKGCCYRHHHDWWSNIWRQRCVKLQNNTHGSQIFRNSRILWSNGSSDQSSTCLQRS